MDRRESRAKQEILAPLELRERLGLLVPTARTESKVRKETMETLVRLEQLDKMEPQALREPLETLE